MDVQRMSSDIQSISSDAQNISSDAQNNIIVLCQQDRAHHPGSCHVYSLKYRKTRTPVLEWCSNPELECCVLECCNNMEPIPAVAVAEAHQRQEVPAMIPEEVHHQLKASGTNDC